MYSCKSARIHAAPPRVRKRAGDPCAGLSCGIQQLITANRTKRHIERQGLFGLGVPEIAVIAGVAALIFGPSKLPELGKAAGQTAKSFQDAAKEFNEELKKGLEENEGKEVGIKVESGESRQDKTPAAEKESDALEKKKE